ncbi:putative AraC-family transcriptional regulator [Actinoplanes missouriensis 431]|uniref:Putative AraC-family transcriptional regulator n=1 Tax=Actinoplanes missouriensis (strain ATCC 14538 / DSM 43046 / CBS 188.64 / JCM 3121 / NBRC 102363 / NCIMB 12654 / NRRL B-3342 / UNCC 431) TaxID=512565 RepID=I0H486_ACTM4|nr:AraC family transcriptional regulator [Actinoplanes missouriensis]BAL87823.1 putative AraC-family transcriptional regulator [Actinoplanes missouriensis 431]
MESSDRLTPLLHRFRVTTQLFHAGPLCGVTTFAARPGRGFLHILRQGEMAATHREPGGAVRRIEIDRPTLLFYPQPLEHVFHNAPSDVSDFTCASLDVEGGATHPLMRTLPPVLTIPLDALAGWEPLLQLLFDEVDSVRCGQRLVADRLFEVVLIRLLRWILDHAGELGIPSGILTGLADPRLAPSLIALHESPEADWKLDSMAREARMSRSAFAAHFKEVIGSTPGQYLTQWRLTIAQERLRAGAAVSTIAAELGYANASSFSRVFSQHLGTAPTNWLAAPPQSPIPA